MSDRSLWKYVPLPGPVLSLALIGLVLLSGLLYYRAIKIQRFLEPALAISQPRNEFSSAINQLFQKEFGEDPLSGIKIRTSSIVMKKSLLFSENGRLTEPGKIVLRKLDRIFLSLLKSDATRSYISIVLINARFPSDRAGNSDSVERAGAQRMGGTIQDSLLSAEPELKKKYGSFFVAAAQPAYPEEGTSDLIELRIILSELIHIEVLQKLMKYAY